jgi:PKD repeat protein
VRAGVVVAAVLAFNPSTAAAAPPAVSIAASVKSGAAPLNVAFTVSGDAATYHWDFGDGAVADGPAVQHVYAAGAFTARVTATNPSGEASTASVRVLSYALRLRSRGTIGYGGHLKFTGRLVPGLRGVRIALYGPDGKRAARGRTHRGGSFAIGVPVKRPGAYQARFGGAASNPAGVRVRPALEGQLVGPGLVGRPLALSVRVRPVAAGPVRVLITRKGRLVRSGLFANGARIRLPSGRVADYRIALSTASSSSYARAARRLRAIVAYPRLAVGSHGPSVLALNQALARLHIALGAVDSSFGLDTRDAVVTFQKLRGLPRTGSVDARFWRVLGSAHVPRPRYGGDHIEVSKALQVLFVVRGGQVVLATHVSTGATGNTPVGRWHVYAKTPGWLANGMFDSSFFLRGFAIHGYPEVPFFPASHGCVRLPVWLAPRIYGLAGVGSIVYVY